MKLFTDEDSTYRIHIIKKWLEGNRPMFYWISIAYYLRKPINNTSLLAYITVWYRIGNQLSIPLETFSKPLISQASATYWSTVQDIKLGRFPTEGRWCHIDKVIYIFVLNYICSVVAVNTDAILESGIIPHWLSSPPTRIWWCRKGLESSSLWLLVSSHFPHKLL